MDSRQDERLHSELALIEAMYPAQVMYDARSKEVKYASDAGSFQLRLPDGYLFSELPEVLSASIAKADLREEVKRHIQSCAIGEEIIDSIIAYFTELEECLPVGSGARPQVNGESPTKNGEQGKTTIIVWLHHLLNTNKRKQALSPPADEVSGITKPGYPGVLLYSGLSKAVRTHVDELRQLNWQAFQVRLETDEEWRFKHGSGVKEVESMREVVADVEDMRKEEFMEAMRMK